MRIRIPLPTTSDRADMHGRRARRGRRERGGVVVRDGRGGHAAREGRLERAVRGILVHIIVAVRARGEGEYERVLLRT
jgi:hypothetical protein